MVASRDHRSIYALSSNEKWLTPNAKRGRGGLFNVNTMNDAGGLAGRIIEKAKVLTWINIKQPQQF